MNCFCSRTAAVALDLARFAGPYECNNRRCWWNVKSTVPCMHQMRQRATEAYSTLQSTQCIRRLMPGVIRITRKLNTNRSES